MEPYKIEILNEETGEYVEGTPTNGDQVKMYYQTGTNSNGDIIGYNLEMTYVEKTEEQLAREWRDNELNLTDSYLNIPDWPKRENYILYRKKLRNWPETQDFPHNKPTIDLNMKAYTHREFYALIGDTVLIELLELAKTDPIVQAIKEKFDKADVIYSNDTDLIAGLTYLQNHEQMTNLTQEIINSIIT